VAIHDVEALDLFAVFYQALLKENVLDTKWVAKTQSIKSCKRQRYAVILILDAIYCLK
jgi:hypothetical protein